MKSDIRAAPHWKNLVHLNTIWKNSNRQMLSEAPTYEAGTKKLPESVHTFKTSKQKLPLPMTADSDCSCICQLDPLQMRRCIPSFGCLLYWSSLTFDGCGDNQRAYLRTTGFGHAFDEAHVELVMVSFGIVCKRCESDEMNGEIWYALSILGQNTIRSAIKVRFMWSGNIFIVWNN